VKSLADRRDTADLLDRLARLRPDSPPRWGRMTAPQMVCHLRDAFLMGTAAKPVSHVATLYRRTVVKWLALYGPLRWPAGLATRPEIDQTIAGTRPGEFTSDVAALAALIVRVTSEPDFFRERRHPIFGPLSDASWRRWAYLHVDHHLRQYGL
jgi:hypothetical protein